MADKPDSFGVGSFEVARNPDARTFVEKLNRLREAVDSCRLQPGSGYTVSRSSNGTVLSIRPAGGGGEPAPESHPWKVSVITQNGRKNFKVLEASVLDQVTVQNLNGLIPIPQNSLPAHCVLEVPLDANLQPGVASIVAVPQAQYAGLVEPQNAPQTKCTKILATLQADGVLVQAVRKNMVLVLANNGGFAAKIALEV